MIKLTIEPDGTVKTIYTDELADYFAETGAKITRASSVEPCEGGWSVDLSPTTKYPLTLGPFRYRKDALDAEVKWLEENWL